MSANTGLDAGIFFELKKSAVKFTQLFCKKNFVKNIF
jgi:hypothetical protein